MFRQITEELLMAWVGNQGNAETQIAWMAKCLVEIANGEYTEAELRSDIESYNE